MHNCTFAVCKLATQSEGLVLQLPVVQTAFVSGSELSLGQLFIPMMIVLKL